jgi:hypothetical protein
MTESPPTLAQATAPSPVAEPNVFLPRGRIGVCSMVFRWTVCFGLLAAAGFLLRQAPEGSRHLISACVSYIIWAFMIITGIKRAHDMGYSAWGVLFLSVLPFLYLLPGEKTANKYGAVPSRWV